MDIILKTILGVMTGFFGFYYVADVIKNKNQFSGKPWSAILGTGFPTNFFDTLGIGSLAPQTAILKFFKLVDDRLIPGTMNVGNTIPTVVQAFIFMTIGLTGWKLAFIVVMSFIFGALQTIGVGFYAPCMAMVYMLGLHPQTAFPIMMTATAMLMVAGSGRFIKENAYDRKTAISLSIAGVMGVFLAAFVIKSLPLIVMKWVVCVVVIYTSIWMFVSAARKEDEKIPSINNE